MRIAIIGTGAVGGALARALTRAGHAVTLGARDPAEGRASALARETGAALARPAAAAAGAEVVALAVPWDAAETAARSLGELAGRIVIDCTNPLGMADGALALTLGFSDSGGERVQGWLPGARVVKTLNQTGAEVMADAFAMAARPVMFMAGDDAAAKATVAAMLAAIGFEPLDAGPLRLARLLEPFGMTWINQAIARGEGRDWAFAVARRTGA